VFKIKNIIFLCILFIGCGGTRVDYYIKTVPNPSKYFASVSVIQENWDSYWTSGVAYRALITELMDVGFKVVEMENLDIILDEQRRQYSGLVEENKEKKDTKDTRFLNKTTISELGKMLGVEYLIPIYIVPTGRKVNMATMRLVSVETGEVVTSTTIATPALGKDVDTIMKQVALDMAESFSSGKKITRNSLFGSNNIIKSDGDKAINKFLKKLTKQK